MSGVMVIANRATAARDILSGTIHKLTLWLDDVRRKPDMKLLLDKPQVDEIAVGTEHRLTKKACLSLTMHRIYSIQMRATELARKGRLALAHQVPLRRSYERYRRERSVDGGSASAQLISFQNPNNRTTRHFNTGHIKKL